jgi:hypothetical protein
MASHSAHWGKVISEATCSQPGCACTRFSEQVEATVFLALLDWRTVWGSPSPTILVEACLQGVERGAPPFLQSFLIFRKWECIHIEITEKINSRRKYDLYKLLQVLEYRRKLDQIGDERNQFRLLSGSWSKWTLHVRKEKSAKLLKYLEIDQIASLHWQRYTCKPFVCCTVVWLDCGQNFALVEPSVGWWYAIWVKSANRCEICAGFAGNSQNPQISDTHTSSWQSMLFCFSIQMWSGVSSLPPTSLLQEDTC